eukprot:RCo032356
MALRDDGYSDGVARTKWCRFPVRVRPHRNPLADSHSAHPICPDDVPWASFYPGMEPCEPVKFLDIGCAYGGFLVKLSGLFPEVLMLGMEIRERVVQFAQSRIEAARQGMQPTPVPRSAGAQQGSSSNDWNFARELLPLPPRVRVWGSFSLDNFRHCTEPE